MSTIVKVTQKNLRDIEKMVPVDVFLRITEIQRMNDKYGENTEIIIGEPMSGEPEYITSLPSGYREMLILNSNEDCTVYFSNANMS